MPCGSASSAMATSPKEVCAAAGVGERARRSRATTRCHALDATALCRGALRSSLHPEALCAPNATALCGGSLRSLLLRRPFRNERNDPRDKPVAFLLGRAFGVEASVTDHGTRPWHCSFSASRSRIASLPDAH